MTNVRLAFAAARLSRSSPENWQQFVAEFEAHAAAQAGVCIQSPTEQLQRNQGHAQQAAHLLKVFQNCRQMADKYEDKQK